MLNYAHNSDLASRAHRQFPACRILMASRHGGGAIHSFTGNYLDSPNPLYPYAAVPDKIRYGFFSKSKIKNQKSKIVNRKS